jgi:hypothetical protein
MDIITPKIAGTIPGAEYGFAPKFLKVGMRIDIKKIASPKITRKIDVLKSALSIFLGFILSFFSPLPNSPHGQIR